MGNIDDFGKDIIKKALIAAIYKALGPDLTKELNTAGCILSVDYQLNEYNFDNLTLELQEE